MKRWSGPGLTPTDGGPHWWPGDGKNLKVRVGPDYKGQRQKCDSDGTMYKALGCYALTGEQKIEDILERLIRLEDLPSWSETGEGGSAEWTVECPIPRIICINLMLPFEAQLNPFWTVPDPGASFVAFFHITPETLRAATGDELPPAMKLLIDFCNGPAGEPGGPKEDPSRSLAARLHGSKDKDLQSGIFKANAKCLNPDVLSVPQVLHDYNGKPCLITKSGYVVKDPGNEWIELGIDVRCFNMVVRKLLCSYRDTIPQTILHFAFLVQATEDDELPEQILCDMYISGVNIVKDPTVIDTKGDTKWDMQVPSN